VHNDCEATRQNEAKRARREDFVMKGYRVNRRSLLLGMAAAPAIMNAARAAPMTLRLSSSLPNNPKFANGRVYYDNLVKRLATEGLADGIDNSSPTISSARRSTS
jgi:hypothetical protein